jgi:hypothetical protein
VKPRKWPALLALMGAMLQGADGRGLPILGAVLFTLALYFIDNRDAE